MPMSPENLAMFESDWPGAGWNQGKSDRLPGPRRDDGLDTLTPGRLAKFHPPEIVVGLATNPRAAGVPDIEALFRAAL